MSKIVSVPSPAVQAARQAAVQPGAQPAAHGVAPVAGAEAPKPVAAAQVPSSGPRVPATRTPPVTSLPLSGAAAPRPPAQSALLAAVGHEARTRHDRDLLAGLGSLLKSGEHPTGEVLHQLLEARRQMAAGLAGAGRLDDRNLEAVLAERTLALFTKNPDLARNIAGRLAGDDWMALDASLRHAAKDGGGTTRQTDQIAPLTQMLRILREQSHKAIGKVSPLPYPAGVLDLSPGMHKLAADAFGLKPPMRPDQAQARTHAVSSELAEHAGAMLRGIEMSVRDAAAGTHAGWQVANAQREAVDQGTYVFEKDGKASRPKGDEASRALSAVDGDSPQVIATARRFAHAGTSQLLESMLRGESALPGGCVEGGSARSSFHFSARADGKPGLVLRCECVIDEARHQLSASGQRTQLPAGSRVGLAVEIHIDADGRATIGEPRTRLEPGHRPTSA